MSPKILSILAIVASLFIVTLIALQVAEMKSYDKAPSVWPESGR